MRRLGSGVCVLSGRLGRSCGSVLRRCRGWRGGIGARSGVPPRPSLRSGPCHPPGNPMATGSRKRITRARKDEDAKFEQACASGSGRVASILPPPWCFVLSPFRAFASASNPLSRPEASRAILRHAPVWPLTMKRLPILYVQSDRKSEEDHESAKGRKREIRASMRRRRRSRCLDSSSAMVFRAFALSRFREHVQSALQARSLTGYPSARPRLASHVFPISPIFLSFRPSPLSGPIPAGRDPAARTPGSRSVQLRVRRRPAQTVNPYSLSQHDLRRSMQAERRPKCRC